MGRHEQREQVFKLLYRVEFHAPEDMPEQIARIMRKFLPGRMQMPLRPALRRSGRKSPSLTGC